MNIYYYNLFTYKAINCFISTRINKVISKLIFKNLSIRWHKKAKHQRKLKLLISESKQL